MSYGTRPWSGEGPFHLPVRNKMKRGYILAELRAGNPNPYWLTARVRYRCGSAVAVSNTVSGKLVVK